MDFDVAIVGAGAVGLASARAFALKGLSVVTLESAGAIGEGVSSRSSEVVHGGMYYPPGSLKAQTCVEGRRRLYEFCAKHDVAARKCGKLIVASEEAETAALEAIAKRALKNGVEGLRMLSGREAKRLEPMLACSAALLSPETGIFDSHGYMVALQGEAGDHGAAFAFHTPFIGAEISASGARVFAGGAEPIDLSVRILVNAAGLGASAAARSIQGIDASRIPVTRYAKGNYFSLPGRAPFQRLIYPAPVAHGLGIHLTFDLSGQVRFGPDVEWVETPDYAVDPDRAASFAVAIRRYWPGAPADALAPAYAGIRPKISAPNEPAADFRLDVTRLGDARVVNLYGIESPGLTASLALAERVVAAAGA